MGRFSHTIRTITTISAAGLVAVGVAVVGATSHQTAGASTAREGFHSSGTCTREKPLVRRALERSTLRVDVDGDGRLDMVAVVTDHTAGKRCRAFVGVRVRGGSTYSIPLDRTAVPPRGARAQIIGLPDLGNDPGAEIVVDTHARTDSALSQMFTLTRNGLKRVHLPAFEDGTFVVEGGGVSEPRGASCTRRGGLILSMALLVGDKYEVTRHRYPVRGDRLQLLGPYMTSTQVPGSELATQFPEFVRPHWRSCTGKVLR